MGHEGRDLQGLIDELDALDEDLASVDRGDHQRLSELQTRRRALQEQLDALRGDPSATRTVLVVANKTLAGPALHRELRRRARAQRLQVFVIVPATPPDPETEEELVDDDLIEAGRSAARTVAGSRLDEVVKQLQAQGFVVTGDVGPPDPLEAVTLALQRWPEVNEVIVSTLPAGVSRWLKLDLPSRLTRRLDVPVTTLEHPDDPREPKSNTRTPGPPIDPLVRDPTEGMHFDLPR
ncbi:MAG: conjugal transfer protein TraF [Actinobacteria bacterium]|nr:conjugal transfer protein TraF [Actinomycetota bacterium]